MKKLLFKCLMVVAVFGLLIPFLGVQSANADQGCFINEILQMDENTIRVKFTGSPCATYMDKIRISVYLPSGNLLLQKNTLGNDPVETRYYDLPINITPGAAYTVKMYRFVPVGSPWKLADTLIFYGGI